MSNAIRSADAAVSIFGNPTIYANPLKAYGFYNRFRAFTVFYPLNRVNPELFQCFMA